MNIFSRLVSRAITVSVLSVSFALPLPKVAGAQTALDPSHEDDKEEKAPKGFRAPSVVIAGIGGYHTAVGDTETAEPPLGVYGVSADYELFFGEETGWAYAVGALFLSSTAPLESGYAYLGFASRASYYTNPDGPSSLVFWVGFGGGLAGYNVNTFGISTQGGINYMLTKNLGLGFFANMTTLLAAEGIEIGDVLINDFDGATAFNLGGSLVVRFSI